MRKLFLSLLLCCPVAAFSQGSVPSREMALEYQERFTTVYLTMNLTEQQLIEHMENFFGQDFSVRKNADGTTDLINIVKRDGMIVYLQTVATFPSRE